MQQEPKQSQKRQENLMTEAAARKNQASGIKKK
jgi:hypothetical protein